MSNSEIERKERTIRAYDLVFEKNQFIRLYNIKKKIGVTPFSINKAHISSFIFGDNTPQIEMVARQYLTLRLCNPQFNERLIRNLAFEETISHELPSEWRKILKEEKIKVDGFVSRLKFSRFILFKFLNNIKHGSIMLALLFLSRKKEPIPSKKYVQFCDLTEPCIPWSGAENDYTIINWYINWEGKKEEIDEIHHNLNKSPFRYKSYDIVPARHFYQYITSFRSKITLLFWFLVSVGISLYSLMLGRWMNALLLLEAFFGKMIELTDRKFLPEAYLFTISSFSFRPLWTHSAEKKGSEVFNISYASSFGGFKTKNGYVDREYYFEMCTWPKIIYWTDDYISFMKSKLEANIEVIHTTPVYLSDYPFTFPEIPTKSVAIFDVSPVDPYITATMIPELPYRNFKNGKEFLLDIYKIFHDAGYSVVWKRKRSFASVHSKDYIKFCDEFENLKGVIMIHPDVSAFHVIEKCDVIISMPFTSTAFVAKYFHKPSAFYDNTGMLYKDDRGTQGIPLISGINELNSWMNQIEIA